MFVKLKYSKRVVGLILVSPLCKAPSWKEWICNKVKFLVTDVSVPSWRSILLLIRENLNL